MANITEGHNFRRPESGVRLAVSNEDLSALSLPTQELWKGRTLLAKVGEHEIGVGVFALPPRETGLSKFWSAVTRRRGETPEAVRLQIEPPIPMTDFKKGEHTRLSAMHPYVVMENDTRYGIGVWIPKGLFSEWSEPQERPEPGTYFGEREVFIQRRVPALLIRLDGETPLTESRSPLGERQEMLRGIPEPTDRESGDISLILARRLVSGVRGRVDQAEVSDLTFTVIAEKGTEGNAVIDNKGQVQVVVVQVTEDHVIEKISNPKIINAIDSELGSQDRQLQFGRFDRAVPKAPSEDTTLGVDSTLRGETRFTGTRRSKVSITSITDVSPLAELNLVLVGNGGPIIAEMTEANIPQQS